MNTEQVKGFLQRIGLEEELPVNAVTLEKLIKSSLIHIPFENLDAIEKNIAPSLEIEDIYQKVVEEQRGGWCFELNKLLLEVLKGMGYACYPIAVRIVWMRPALTAATHRATIVELDQKLYYVDIGYGGPGPKGLVALEEGIQEIGGVKFRVATLGNNIWQIEREYEDDFSRMLYFELKEAVEIDFNLPNFYCAKNENVIFSSRIVCNLMTEDGNIGLNDRVLTIKKGNETVTKEFQTKEEVFAGLKEYFGLVVK